MAKKISPPEIPPLVQTWQELLTSAQNSGQSLDNVKIGKEVINKNEYYVLWAVAQIRKASHELTPGHEGDGLLLFSKLIAAAPEFKTSLDAEEVLVSLVNKGLIKGITFGVDKVTLN